MEDAPDEILEKIFQTNPSQVHIISQSLPTNTQKKQRELLKKLVHFNGKNDEIIYERYPGKIKCSAYNECKRECMKCKLAWTVLNADKLEAWDKCCFITSIQAREITLEMEPFPLLDEPRTTPTSPELFDLDLANLVKPTYH